MMLSVDDELERAAVASWPAETVEHLGDWVLRANDGFTRRANSAAVLGPPPPDPAAAIRAAEAFYADRDRPSLFQVADTERTAPVRAALAAAGYVADDDTILLTRSIDDVSDPIVASPSDPATLRVAAEPTADWFDLWWSIDGRGEQLRDTAHALFSRLRAPVAFASRHVGGSTVAVQLGVCRRGRLGLFCAATAPTARRQGHAVVIADRLGAWAVSQGATSSYVQVMATNDASLALSEGLGYERGHRYQYWSRPTG